MGNSSSSRSSSSAGSTSSIPASKVLKIIDLEEKERGRSAPVTDRPTPDGQDLWSGLSALGVDAGESSVPEAARCWKVVAEQDFWRNHYAEHPRRKRVKAWMFVHSRFRASASSVVQAAEAMQAAIVRGSPAKKTEAAAKGVEKSFRTLLSKIDAHSEFEDTQLFRFFVEHLPEKRDDIRDLEADHSEKQQEDVALSALKPLREEPAAATSEQAAAAVVALKSYAAGLEGHLEREERALVATWLNLAPDQYAKYRTYLVGKYRLVY